jgi:hypothetical protein
VSDDMNEKILFDYWMPRLTDGQFKVLMAIARKTYGWHKKKDAISLFGTEQTHF